MIVQTNGRQIRCDRCGRSSSRFEDCVHFYNRTSVFDDPRSYCGPTCFEQDYLRDQTELPKIPTSLRERCEMSIAVRLAGVLSHLPRGIVRWASFARLSNSSLED